MFTYSNVLNLLDTLFGVGTLIYWQALAFGTTMMVVITIMVVYYKEGEIPDIRTIREGCLGVIVILALLISYLGCLFAYLWNKPLGAPLELIVR